MHPPALLVGAALIFWGWQTGHPLAGAGLALLAEASRATRLRFDLNVQDSYRVADLCTLLLAGVVVALMATRGVSAGVLASLQWLPPVLAPLVAVQDFGRTGRLKLSALFQSLRRRKARDPSVPDPDVDLRGAYLALALIAAGAAADGGHSYYIGVVALAAVGLAYLRPRRVPLFAFAALFAAAAGLGYAGHVGLSRLQAVVESLVVDWLLTDLDTDPYRSTTEIGALGRSKLHDTIVARVYADRARLRLLHRASYNAYGGTTWFSRNAPMAAIEPPRATARWLLASGPAPYQARIVARGDGARAVLALPAGSRSIAAPAGALLARNGLGTVRIDAPGSWIGVDVGYGDAIADTAPPGEEDRFVPHTERAVLEAIARDLGLRAQAPDEAIRRVAGFLAGFSYSLYREQSAATGHTPLADFLLRTRSGHCEYFATATTLLFRAAGIPARYATGYAVLEWSALEQAYVVRARHAHAWSRVWLHGGWRDLDTTPPSWAQEEAQLDPVWTRFADFLRWLAFRWSQRETLAADEVWFGALAVLVAVLAWRLLRGRKLLWSPRHAPAAYVGRQGLDSEFYAIERAWTPRTPRPAHETFNDWALRAAAAASPSVRQRLLLALALHERLRFDPAGLDARERRLLGDTCTTLAEVTVGR